MTLTSFEPTINDSARMLNSFFRISHMKEETGSPQLWLPKEIPGAGNQFLNDGTQPQSPREEDSLLQILLLSCLLLFLLSERHERCAGSPGEVLRQTKLSLSFGSTKERPLK